MCPGPIRLHSLVCPMSPPAPRSLTYYHDVELKPHLHGLDLQLVQHGINAHIAKRLVGWGPGAGGS